LPPMHPVIAPGLFLLLMGASQSNPFVLICDLAPWWFKKR
jgi:hypothetical protein